MLRKIPKSNVWIYQCKIKGKTWTRSTGETDYNKALKKAALFAKTAELHRKQPARLQKFSEALVAEIERIETDVSKSEADRIYRGMKNFLKWLGKDVALESIDSAILEEYQRRRLKKVATNTVNRELYAILRLLRENGFEVKKPKPAKRIKRTEQREFTTVELQRFFSGCLEESHKGLFLLLLATGARPAEIIPSMRSSHIALLKRELNDEECTVTIRTAKLKLGQKQKIRVIKIPKDLMSLIRVIGQENQTPFVFCPNSKLCKLFDRILKRAKIRKQDELGRKLTAHSFRHTYATLIAGSVGCNPFLLKEVLGHSQISTTERYCHPTATAAIIDVSEFLGVNAGCKSTPEMLSERFECAAT